MRIRSIKPEFWTSEDIGALCWDDRLLFIGLWSYVDDNGVGRDVEKIIRADLFALDDDPLDSLARVSRGLARLSDAFLVARYKGPDGKPYLYITGWGHQKIDKPAKPRYPLPPADIDTFATPSRHPRETFAPGTGEQRNRGTEEQEQPSSPLAAASDRQATPKPKKISEPWRADVSHVCETLAEAIEDNGSKRPTITDEWRRAARLMIDRDERTTEQIVAAIKWSQAHHFWKSNILSMPKLREKYDQLRLRAQSENTPRASPVRSTTDDRVSQTLDLGRRLAEREAQQQLRQIGP